LRNQNMGHCPSQFS